MDISELLPRHKHDHKRVSQIAELGYPAYQSILPELFEWIQDMNWPIAPEIVPLLIASGRDAIPVIRTILRTDDYFWQYWTLKFVLQKMPRDVIEEFILELERLRDQSCEIEKDYDLHETAACILNSIQ